MKISLKKLNEVGELVPRDSLMPPPRIPKPTNDEWRHCCRWCKNYNNSLHTCSVLSRKLYIIDANDPYAYLDEPIVEIDDAENFSCSEWQ